MDPFVALADPVRRDLVVRLSRGSARVVDLAAEHAISRPAISRHLRLLAEAGVVAAEDRGRERHYRLEPAGLEPVAVLLAALLTPAGPRPEDAPLPTPPITERMLDGLELEVRRTGRERRTTGAHSQPAHSQPAQEDTA